MEPVESEFVGGEVPAAVRELIEASKQAPPEQTASILWGANALFPGCLPVYYLLYKFHASRGELADAERAARAALVASGEQASLPGTIVGDPPENLRAHVDFQTPGPARFWLFTLKALAFISTRQGRLEEARRLVSLLTQCDPSHSVGSEVTAALLAAVESA